jgi:hypothetical protein
VHLLSSEQTDTNTAAHSVISNLMQPVRSGLISRNNGFIECRTHKIGKLRSKLIEIDIYNVEIKAILSTIETINVLKHIHRNKDGLLNDKKTFPEYIITMIGNLNTLGLGETQIKIE